MVIDFVAPILGDFCVVSILVVQPLPGMQKTCWS